MTDFPRDAACIVGISHFAYGNLAEVYLQGSTHLLEGVRQLRGTSCNQIDRVDTVLYGSGVGASPGGGMMLGRTG